MYVLVYGKKVKVIRADASINLLQQINKSKSGKKINWKTVENKQSNVFADVPHPRTHLGTF